MNSEPPCPSPGQGPCPSCVHGPGHGLGVGGGCLAPVLSPTSLEQQEGGGTAKPGLLSPFRSAACQPEMSPLLIKINRNPAVTGCLL